MDEYTGDVADDPRNGAENGSPFYRFERLTKRLVAVPKSDVDDLEKRRKRRRSRKPARELPHPRSNQNGD